MKRWMRVLFGWILLQACAWAQPSEEGPRLIMAQTGWQAPDAPVVIRLAQSVPAGVLGLEVDGVDVSAMMRRQAGTLRFQPVSPLSPGAHEVRLLLETPDGGLEELGVWTLMIRESEAFQKVEGSASASFSLHRRMTASSSTAPEWAADGSLSLEGQVETGDWSADGSMEVGYDSAGLAANGDQAELSRWQAGIRGQTLALQMGHQTLLPDNLLSDGSTHRGILASAGEVDRRTVRGRVFTARPDSISGFEHFFGTDDERNRVAGAQVTVFPVKARKTLALEAGGYAGRMTDPVLLTEQSGEGWNVVLSDRLLGDRLTLRAEYARTRWDADGRGTLATAIEDAAWLLGGDWRFQTGEGARAWQWQLSASHGQLGPYFVSLLNPGQQTDQRGTDLRLSFRRGAWEGEIDWQRLRNNVEDDGTQPTTLQHQTRAAVGYAFEQPVAGLQRVDAALTMQSRSPIYVPTGYLGTLVNDRSLGMRVETRWQWGETEGTLSWQGSRLRDRLVAANDADTRQWQVSLSRTWSLDNGWMLKLTPGWSWSETRYRLSGQADISEMAQMDMALEGLAAGRMRLYLTPSWQAEDAPSSLQRTETHSLSGGMDYALQQGTGLKPGISLGVSGSWDRTQDLMAGTDTENWQVYGHVRLEWQ